MRLGGVLLHVLCRRCSAAGAPLGGVLPHVFRCMCSSECGRLLGAEETEGKPVASVA